MTIDWFTFVVQIINFAVLIALLKHFLYGPVTAAMERRQADIDARIHQAEQQQQAAEEAESHFRQQSHALEHQRDRLMEEARQETEQRRRELVAEARSEVDSRRQEWLDALAREQEQLVDLVQQKAGQQVVTISRNALDQLCDATLEQQAVEKFIAQIEHSAGPELISMIDDQESPRAAIKTAFPLPSSQQDRLQELIQKRLPAVEAVGFQVIPELLCGIELVIGSQKIGWSIQDYLDTLREELKGAFLQTSGA